MSFIEVSNCAEKPVSVLICCFFELRGGEIEDVGRLDKDVANVRARRDTRPYHGISFDKETVEGDFLDEFAVIHCMVVQDCWPYGDEAVELDNLRYKPIGAGKAMEEKICEL